MGEPLVDAVRLDVTSKATLTGLDQSIEKLRAMEACLDAIHARLMGFNMAPGLTRTKKQIEEILRSATNTKTLPMSDVARALDFDLAKFKDHVAKWKEVARNKDALTREGTKKGMNELAFTSPGQAARAAMSYQAAEAKAFAKASEQVRALFPPPPGAPPPPPSPPKAVQPELPKAPPAPVQAELPKTAAPVPLEVPAAKILATLGPGMVTLLVPAERVKAVSDNAGLTSAEIKAKAAAAAANQPELPPKAPPPSGEGKVPVDVAARIMALLGPGIITLTVPTSQVQAVATGASPAAGAAKKGKGGAAPSAPAAPEKVFSKEVESLLSELADVNEPSEDNDFEPYSRKRAIRDLHENLEENPTREMGAEEKAMRDELRRHMIEQGVYKHVTDEDLAKQTQAGAHGAGKKYDFTMGGKKYQWVSWQPMEDTAPPAGGKGGKPPIPTALGSTTPGGASGALLEEKITTTEASRQVQRKELLKAGQTVDNFFKEVDGALEHQKEVLTTSPVKAARAKMDSRMASLKAELEAHLAGTDMGTLHGQDKTAQLLRKQAEMVRSFTGTAEKPSDAARELTRLGQGDAVTKARAAASKMERRAARIEEQAINQRQAEMGEDMRRQGQIRQELHAARQRGDAAEAARLKEQRRQMEARIKSQNRMLAAGQKSQDRADAEWDKHFQWQHQQTQAVLRGQYDTLRAEHQYQAFLDAGGVEKSHRRNPLYPAGPASRMAERELPSGDIERLTISYGKNGVALTELTKAQSAARREGGYLAADFLKNTAKVTLWAASVGVLYKSLELVTSSIGKLVAIGPQLGRLEQVFKGVGGTAQQLTVDIMGLASANGAEVSQAMEAGIQWSRLGLSRVQVNEAVRVSLMAANVAQIDALEATEALQGVMQAYGLGVGQLRGELGQIVQITNSYNVTNRDMLVGLSRCAAVAHQAGLPLAELQGLLGATIGGTSQTGANIGNMMKSVMLALSNPELQSKLRMRFKFEPTTGGDEIKDMSRMLGDVFIKFNQLNGLQKQSFLFTVAGRTQASRLEAMLQGYMKAQYLAVNAQLHLNTAEQENEKIVAALRTQVKGLCAEWERFVFIQGNRGPVEAMGQLMTAMRNVLKLMNTPMGANVTTGLMGFMAAGGMKAIITGMALKGGDTFVGRTKAGIAGALGNFNQSLNALYMQTMAPRLMTRPSPDFIGPMQPRSVRDAANFIGPLQPLSRLERVGRGLNAGAALGAEKFYVWGEAMLRVGRSASICSAEVRGLFTIMGATTKMIGAGLLAFKSWLLPILAVYSAVEVFNMAMEKMGLASDKAQAKLAGFNTETERAAAAANAFAEASQALGTLQRAITPEAGFEGMPAEDRAKYLAQAQNLVGMYEPDPDKRRGIQEAFGKELMALNAQNDALGVQKKLEGERLTLGKKRLEQLQMQAVSIASQERANQAEIKRLTDAQHGKWTGHFGHDTRERLIAELQKQSYEATGAATRNMVEQTDTYEQAFAYSEKWAAELETQKLLWSEIASIFQTIKANNPMEESALKIQALDAENDAIDAQIALLNHADDLDEEGIKKRADARKKSQEQIRANSDEQVQLREVMRNHGIAETDTNTPFYNVGTRDEFAGKFPWNVGAALKEKLDLPFETKNGPPTHPGQRLKDLKEEMDKLLMNAPAEEAAAAPEMVQREHARQEYIKQKAKNEEAREAQARNQLIFETRTRAIFGHEEGEREVLPMGVGRDETQKFLEKRKGIMTRLAELSALPQDDAMRLSREIELQNQLYETQGSLRRRSFETEREITQLKIDQRREAEHALLGAGPGEMLRMLAAGRMGAGGRMGMGQFMGLSPDMRRDVARWDTRFDPRMIDLQVEARRQGRPGVDEFARQQMETTYRHNELSDRLRGVLKGVGVAPKADYEAAVKTMNVTAGTVNVTAPTVMFNGTLVVNAPFTGPTINGTGAAPKLPQAGGRGAGAGHL